MIMPEFNPVNRLNYLVELKVKPGFDDEFADKVKEADPILVFNHQAHADGLLAAVVVGHLLETAKRIKREHPLKGFVMPAARSLINGRQSRLLQMFYIPFNLLMSKKGLITLPYTREKDKLVYGMSGETHHDEIKTIRKYLHHGYGMAVFPEGSVQGGRHPKGCAPEEIYGMQEVKGNEIINSYRLMRQESTREIFYVVCGLHGGFRLQNPNIKSLSPTKEGLATFFGIPGRFVPHVRAEASLGAIITEKSIAQTFGRDWPDGGKGQNGSDGRDQKVLGGINRFIMDEVALLVPSRARGFYAIKLQDPLGVS